MRAECVLAVSHSLAVEVNIVSGLNSVELYIYASAAFQHRAVGGEYLLVDTYGVVVGGSLRHGHIAVVFSLPRLVDVGVDRKVKALTGPAFRQLNGLPYTLIGIVDVLVVQSIVNVALCVLGVLDNSEPPVLIFACEHLEIF